MFDQSADSLGALARTVRELAPAPGSAAQIDQIRDLEDLASAVAAAQARVGASFAVTRQAERVAAGTPAERASEDVAAQIGLAKRISPFHARRWVGWAGILVGELPETLRALSDGVTSEWRAMIVARETAWLSREHRAQIDREIAPRLAGLGDRRVEAEVKSAAYRLDPEGYLGRIRGAVADRRVTLRPAPETMARLTGFLPVAQGVAAFTALRQHADTLIGQGDTRGRGQIMADTLVQRLTGQESAGDVAVVVNLVMTDQALLADFVPWPETDADSHAQAGSDAETDSDSHAHADADAEADQATDGSCAPCTPTGGADPRHEPAVLDGYGPIPARLARDLIATPDQRTPRWLRRLFLSPPGRLVAMESHRRAFTTSQREFLRLRDQTCRTPWCDAPIRHTDHVRPVADGGPTSVDNGQGLCAACNYAKQAPGWHTVVETGGEIGITTPTGHRYQSRAPDPPGGAGRRASPVVSDPAGRDAAA